MRRKRPWWGITWHRRVGRWQLSLSLASKTVHGGYYDKRIDAAIERNRLLAEHYGPGHGWTWAAQRRSNRRRSTDAPSQASREVSRITAMRALSRKGINDGNEN